MGTQDSEISGNKRDEIDGLGFLMPNELMWWPYRSFSTALLRNHNNLRAFMEANRKLADEMRDIIRREQDLAFSLSARLLEQAASHHHDGTAFSPAAHMGEMYDSAVAGIRELGKAVADAQIRSIETLRAHTKTALNATEQAPQSDTKAA